MIQTSNQLMASRFEKVKEIYRQQGVKAVLSTVNSHLKFRFGISKAYQEDRSEGINQRWEKINPYLNENTSVLDIGCNIGVFTSKAASKTGCAIGIEPSWTAINRAKKKHKNVSGVAFAQKTISPENIDSLPTCDTTFLLSVYHLWYQQNGAKSAKEMLTTVAEKSSHQFFFEPASRKSRYDDQKLSFDDFDEEQIREHNRKLLNEVLSNKWEINYMGKTESREEVGGFRCLFRCSRKNQS